MGLKKVLMTASLKASIAKSKFQWLTSADQKNVLEVMYQKMYQKLKYVLENVVEVIVEVFWQSTIIFPFIQILDYIITIQQKSSIRSYISFATNCKRVLLYRDTIFLLKAFPLKKYPLSIKLYFVVNALEVSPLIVFNVNPPG